MGIKWSDDQLKVIEKRNGDLLVSAAAGSGKTTVLVERIIQMILDEERPVDIDELLVVTFTKAAAGEMKERIAKALDKKLEELEKEESPSAIALKQRLARQSALVLHSMITTIDSFCLFVVKNYFEEINLDPNFRVGETTEIELLEKDVIAKVFEKNYSKEDNEPFFALINAYSDRKKDMAIRDMVEEIYKKSLSAPWPRKWIEGLVDSFEESARGKAEENPSIARVISISKANLLSCRDLLLKAKDYALDPMGPVGYLSCIEPELELIEKALEEDSYDGIRGILNSITFDSLKAGKKGNEMDAEIKDLSQKCRNAARDSVRALIKDFYALSWEEICAQQSRVLNYVKELIRLSIEVLEEVHTEKLRRRVIDFSDMEHFALQILVDEESGEPKAVAEEFRKHFKEIMIDEYQDSNEVQEVILKSISGYYEGNNNMFMVGDVKQSIYRFRMAKPELFVNKYNRYSKEDCKEQRIDLQKNYRSREGVLDFCNVIFRKLMEPELGGIVYDETAQLNPGAEYLHSDSPCAEVLIFDPKEVKSENTDLEDESAIRLEAIMVANKIKELHQTQLIQEDGKLRPADYKDFVILLRSIKSSGPVFQEVLNSFGIPAHVDSTTGYFSAPEVILILNLLSLVDNPYQDIPMASLLKSNLVGYDDEILAEIKVKQNESKLSFAQTALEYLKEDENPFYDFLMELRQRKDLAVHEMIQLIFDRTGYDSYVASLPAGKIRYGNLVTLVEKAIQFESTSYKGVFHFLRYIHQMKKYDKDFGEADADGSAGNIVHIMTIHKSKGLEYPIVFVSGLAKKFNINDEKGNFIIHQELGIGLDEISGSPRKTLPSTVKTIIKNYIHQEMLSEELRVLYVALTRAKERLILTGSKIPENKDFGGSQSLEKKCQAKCFIDWIVPALYAAGYQDFVHEVDVDQMSLECVEEQAKATIHYGQVLQKIADADLAKVNEIKKAFDYEYKYSADIHRKSKYSVSELKHAAMARAYDLEEGEVEVPDFAKKEKEPYIPKFARGYGSEEEVTSDGTPAGALFGTAVHRMMEVLDFASLANIDSSDHAALKAFADSELKRMSESGELEPELKARLRGPELMTFLKSDIAPAMAKAAARGELYREKPFVMTWENDALVQGIIDVFWREEDGSIILLDYKTDSVKDSKELVARYKAQLDLYGDALNRIYGNVKEKLIYSYRLREVISL